MSNILKRYHAIILEKCLFIKKGFDFIKKATAFRHLSSVQVVLCLGVIMVIRGLKKLKLSAKYLDMIYVNHYQRLIRIRVPKVLADPETLRVCITYQCNRNCAFCYSKCPREEFKQHMSLDDFEFLSRWAKSQGWRSLRLLGGEPTIHPDFKSILDIASKQRLTISISTNGLFSNEVNSLLDDGLIESINFSYPQDQPTLEEKQLFNQNLEQTIKKKISVVLSWIIHPNGKDWHEVIDLAKRYRDHIVLRFSMVLPGNQKNFNAEEFQHNFKKLAKQILHISHHAHQNHVAFYFYRPLLRCTFNKAELDYLQSISPFLCYTRCPLNLGGDCAGLRLTINPDLTCYPCPVVHIEGIKITPETTLEDINWSFKTPVTQLCTQPLMDSCKTCEFFINYKRHIENRSSDLADKSVCQGGCLAYRTKEGSRIL